MKSILVTGGASGIGRAVAKLFSERGWRVGLADVNADGMALTAEACTAGDRVSTHLLDVRDFNAWERVLAEFTAGSNGQLDVLFNNAGVAQGGAFSEITPAVLDLVIDVNFRGVAYGARAAYQYLRATPGACLLNSASASAIYGLAGLSAYSASKFAVRGLTEALEGEWANDGIKVRDLIPGFIDTPLLTMPVPGSNRTARDAVVDAKLEFTPVERVAEAAWDAVHGKEIHTFVGDTAFRLARATRWTPTRLRRIGAGALKT